MTETISLQKDRRLLAWDVSHDFRVFGEFLERFGGDIAYALPEFTKRIERNLTGFIGELRRGGTHQLLSSYYYELPEMEKKTAKRVQNTADLTHVNTRAIAMQDGLSAAHQYFRECHKPTQVVVMSPVNEQAGETEHEMTAVYLLTHRRNLVIGRQLFIDLSREERPTFMKWMSAHEEGEYLHVEDLDLARHPVLFSKVLFSTPGTFVQSVKDFLKMQCHRETIGGQSISDPALFVATQRRKRRNNQKEAEYWAKSYVTAITQGVLDLGRQIITSMQMNVLGLTESAVRQAARRAHFDTSALELFLRACGFLEFAFGSGGGSPNGIELLPVGVGGSCQEKICKRCGTHAGERDTKCPNCGWKP